MNSMRQMEKSLLTWHGGGSSTAPVWTKKEKTRDTNKKEERKKARFQRICGAKGWGTDKPVLDPLSPEMDWTRPLLTKNHMLQGGRRICMMTWRKNWHQITGEGQKHWFEVNLTWTGVTVKAIKPIAYEEVEGFHPDIEDNTCKKQKKRAPHDSRRCRNSRGCCNGWVCLLWVYNGKLQYMQNDETGWSPRAQVKHRVRGWSAQVHSGGELQ